MTAKEAREQALKNQPHLAEINLRPIRAEIAKAVSRGEMSIWWYSTIPSSAWNVLIDEQYTLESHPDRNSTLIKISW